MLVYLIHFARPFGRHGAQHYLGATGQTMAARLHRHKHGRGAALLKAVHAAGISFRVVRQWPVDTRGEAYTLEIALKRRHRSRQLCPVCRKARKTGRKRGA